MKIDLHNHSTHSDGKLSVENLIKHAHENGVGVMALTDHDNTFGCDEAILYGNKYGVNVLKGLELSTTYKGEPVHIIGLFKNAYIPDEIIKMALETKKSRRERAILMLKNIRDIFNVEINLDDILSCEVITRGNMFQHITKYNPNIPHEEVNKMVSRKSPAYIEAAKFGTKEGIEFLKNNNCITILAHPTLNSKEIVLDVCKMGVDGIEYRYPKNKPGEEGFFKSLAKEYNLLLSAGSDFHNDSNHADIGTVSLDLEDFKKIEERLGL